MKKTTLIFFLLCLSKFQSQTNPGVSNAECGTVAPNNYAQWKLSISNVQNLVSTLDHDTCLNKKFSIVFYIIADSVGQWGPVTQTNIDSCVARLNRAFKRICVSFVNCSTVVIPNFTFNDWTKTNVESIVTNNWYADKTINIYVPRNIIDPVGAAGYAHLPSPSTKDVIVLRKIAVNSTVTPIHEMGHFFGLLHTFAEMSLSLNDGPSAELVVRNPANCGTKGDGFCDTEADCYPAGLGTQDSNNEYYIRPTDNFMSYHSNRCRFTQQQYNFMARVMITQRLYLH